MANTKRNNYRQRRQLLQREKMKTTWEIDIEDIEQYKEYSTEEVRYRLREFIQTKWTRWTKRDLLWTGLNQLMKLTSFRTWFVTNYEVREMQIEEYTLHDSEIRDEEDLKRANTPLRELINRFAAHTATMGYILYITSFKKRMAYRENIKLEPYD